MIGIPRPHSSLTPPTSNEHQFPLVRAYLVVVVGRRRRQRRELGDRARGGRRLVGVDRNPVRLGGVEDGLQYLGALLAVGRRLVCESF